MKWAHQLQELLEHIYQAILKCRKKLYCEFKTVLPVFNQTKWNADHTIEINWLEIVYRRL